MDNKSCKAQKTKSVTSIAKKRKLTSLTDDDAEQQHHKIKFEENIFEVGKRTYGDRVRTVVTNEWTPIMNDVLWRELRLPCVWSFKHVRYRTSDIFCEAKCAACNATLTISCVHGSYELDITLKKFDENIAHPPNKKRRIRKAKKQEITEMLQKDSSHAVRSKLASQMMEYGDTEPAHLPSSNALRLMKHKNIIQETLSENPIQSLLEMKKFAVNSIQEIGVTPFYVFYASTLQRAWYKSEMSHRWTTISIDATGVHLKSPSESDKYIFLYLISAHG